MDIGIVTILGALFLSVLLSPLKRFIKKNINKEKTPDTIISVVNEAISFLFLALNLSTNIAIGRSFCI